MLGVTKYIWLDGADAEDKIGLIGEGWRKIEISQGEIAQYQSVYGTRRCSVFDLRK